VNQGATPRGLVPPRPNLGPEPWYEAQPIPGVWLGLLILGCVLVGWFFWRWLHHGRARFKRGELAAEDRPDATPRERLVALSNSIREAMTVQYGTTWRAKTTEELSENSQLVQAVGPEGFEELIRFLDQVDHIKFAPERSNQHHESLRHDLEIWEPRVAVFKAKIRAKPGGRPTPQTTDPSLRFPATLPFGGRPRATPPKNRP
jgi:hypothetical protein